MESDKLLELLRKSTREIVGRESQVAVAYSGGLDSSVVAALAKEVSHVRCYTCAVRNSFDALHARERALAESLDFKMIELTQSRLKSTATKAIQALGADNPVQVAYTIPILIVLEESSERTVLVGSGADELFGGYAKYGTVLDPTSQMNKDLGKMLEETDKLREVARSLGKHLGLPFVSKELIEFSESLPLERKIGFSARKVVLRDAAELLRLPSRHFPKKAAQYSSGILKEMERMARHEKKSVCDWTRGLAR